jgi:hypothetical protein
MRGQGAGVLPPVEGVFFSLPSYYYSGDASVELNDDRWTAGDPVFSTLVGWHGENQHATLSPPASTYPPAAITMIRGGICGHRSPPFRR